MLVRNEGVSPVLINRAVRRNIISNEINGLTAKIRLILFISLRE